MQPKTIPYAERIPNRQGIGRPPERLPPMKEEPTKQPDTDMLDEYDFSNGVRGKYADRYHAANNMIRLDPDVAEIFPDAKSVNDALRALANIIAVHQRT